MRNSILENEVQEFNQSRQNSSDIDSIVLSYIV